MNDEKRRKQIGANIASYRKREGWTQAELAEKLNYSNKAISKWERGESVPDVLTLADLAQQLGITVDDLIKDPNALPENTGAVQQVMDQVVQKTLKRKANKTIILGLSSLLVWFVALLLFVVLDALEFAQSWLAFIFAIPVDAVVCLSLRSAWRDFRWNRFLVSAIMWGALLSLYLSLMLFAGYNFWKVFLLGVPGQVAILLWVKLFRKEKSDE